MTFSKLEAYLSILEVLVSRPLQFENILYQVDEKAITIKKYLDFLTVHDLVEKLPLGSKTIVYTITEKGLAVLRTLQEQVSFEDPQGILLVYEALQSTSQ